MRPVACGPLAHRHVPMSENEAEVLIVDEIRRVVEATDGPQISALVDAILQANRVFVCGAGRSGLIMKTFAMRLMHLGVSSHAVGETITPAIEPGDLFICGSGSGQTRTTLATVEAARTRGARTAAITAHATSPIAQSSDLVLHIRSPITTPGLEPPSRQPPGSLFEQCLLVHCEGMVMRLMQRLGTTEEEMRARHTKLE